MRPVDYEVTEEDQSVLTKTQIADVEQKEEATMRTLRIFLRNLVTRLAQEKFKKTQFDVLHHIFQNIRIFLNTSKGQAIQRIHKTS